MFIEIILNERWKPLTYPDVTPRKYLISDHGRIYSNFTNKLLSPVIASKGYKQLKLSTITGAGKQYRVHRLVAWEFVEGFSEEKSFVNHKDGVKINNLYTNLEWVTHKENMRHAVWTGLKPSKDGYRIRIHQGNINKIKYSDDVITRMCELLQEGLTDRPITKIIMKEQPNIDVKEDSVRKQVNRIKRRKYRVDISRNYSF